jgi:hypothetical protein
MGQSGFNQTSSITNSLPKTILPLGMVSHSFTHSVSPNEVGKYLQALEEASFSGYIRCQPLATPNEKPGQGLLVLNRGTILYANIVNVKPQSANGNEALNKLQQLDFNALAVEVAPRLVEAWRSLLDGHKAYAEVAATSFNYQQLLQSFAKSQKTGTIRLYSAQLELYALIYLGQLQGLFHLESKSNSQVHYLQERENDPEILLDRVGAKLDVFLTSPAQALNMVSEHISAADVSLIDRSFQAVVRLSGKIAAPERMSTYLAQVIKKGETQYPVLKLLPELEMDEAKLPRLNLMNVSQQLTRAPKAELLTAFDYLFEEFLQDYCRPIGPEIFHPMAKAAINQTDARQLLALGLHLDFLMDDEPAEPTMPSQLEPINEDNPYDF